jgi:hypothetical protein
MDVVLTRVSKGEADLTGIDPRLAPLLYAALSPEPRRRPEAADVVEALERYAGGYPVTDALPVTRHTQVIEQAATSQWEPAPVVAPGQSWDDQWAEQWSAPVGDAAAWQDEPVPDEQSDWQAAWEGGAGEPDPRIGRPARTGTLLALLAVLVATTAGFPVVALAIALVVSWAARTADRSVTSLVLRRYQKGRRRSDVPFAVVASPWHLVAGALGTVMSALLPLVVGICAVFSAALALVAVTGGTPHPNTAGPLAVGAVITALVAWWGPGGSGLRRGTRSIVRGVSPGPASARILAGAVLALAAGLLLLGAQHGWAPDWYPTQAPSSLLPTLKLG